MCGHAISTIAAASTHSQVLFEYTFINQRGATIQTGDRASVPISGTISAMTARLRMERPIRYTHRKPNHSIQAVKPLD